MMAYQDDRSRGISDSKGTINIWRIASADQQSSSYPVPLSWGTSNYWTSIFAFSFALEFGRRITKKTIKVKKPCL